MSVEDEHSGKPQHDLFQLDLPALQHLLSLVERGIKPNITYNPDDKFKMLQDAYDERSRALEQIKMRLQEIRKVQD